MAKERNWGQSFLLKADRATKTIQLVDKNFKFQWLGHFDASGHYYLYEGESGGSGGGGNGALYLRDMSDLSLRTLVEPSNTGQYALARWYQDTIIYSRTGVVWKVRMDGRNNAPVFPTMK